MVSYHFHGVRAQYIVYSLRLPKDILASQIVILLYISRDFVYIYRLKIFQAFIYMKFIGYFGVRYDSSTINSGQY